MATPRVTHPVRNQGQIRFEMPEDDLPADHPARVLWSAFGKLDLAAFLVEAHAVEGGSGRPTTCPPMLLTLWTYAISRGVGSAREIERLTQSDVSFGRLRMNGPVRPELVEGSRASASST